jgi:Rad3-related DNA helicase
MDKYGIDGLDYKRIDANMPKLLEAVDDVMSHYPHFKGIIHTHTNKIAQYLFAGSKHSHRMLTHTANNREQVLQRFIASKEPLVLVSPSMVEGIDLKDDLGRWQIICKVPYPFLGDAQIKARFDRDPAWYQWKTTLAIIQAVGRIVRHEKDWGHTFVLDPAFKQWGYTVKDLLPDYFKKAVKWNCKELP